MFLLYVRFNLLQINFMLNYTISHFFYFELILGYENSVANM